MPNIPHAGVVDFTIFVVEDVGRMSGEKTYFGNRYVTSVHHVYKHNVTRMRSFLGVKNTAIILQTTL